ncbi:MAG TPA: energy transducer TonB [Bryobacteraceae bacterium]|nr:energy transducer TonB [Bryobacteraceae bacterium]
MHLFEDNLVASGGSLLKRDPWAAVVAVAVQSLIVLLLIITPLFYTEKLPKWQLVSMLYAPPSTAARNSAKLTMPKEISMPASPKAIKFARIYSKPVTHEDHSNQVAATGVADGVVDGVPGGVVGEAPGGVVGAVPGGVLGAVLSSPPILTNMEEPAPMPAKKIRVPSRLAEGFLLHDVAPEYPQEAGRARIEGMVVLLAVIGSDGTVRNLQVKSGLPMLAQAAIDAVKQWRYRPYMLNGEPVEFDTQITINFTLSRG